MNTSGLLQSYRDAGEKNVNLEGDPKYKWFHEHSKNLIQIHHAWYCSTEAVICMACKCKSSQLIVWCPSEVTLTLPLLCFTISQNLLNYTMHNKFSNWFVWVSPSTSDLKFHLLSWRYKRRTYDKHFHLKQNMEFPNAAAVLKWR